MYVATQFSIFMVNKPGVLVQVLSELAKARVNIVAMTMVDSAEHGVMRVIFSAPKKAEQVLAKLNFSYSQTQVLCVNLANKEGATKLLAKIDKVRDLILERMAIRKTLPPFDALKGNKE